MKQLTREHETSWRRMVRRITKSSELTEDVLQESLRRALSSRVLFKSVQDWERYFKRVLVNTALDHTKVRVKANKLSIALVNAVELADHKEDQLKRVLHMERQEQERQILREVRSLIPRLPPKQRQAILLLINQRESETLEDISRREGIAISTLRSRMMSGIRRIRRALIRSGLLSRANGNR